MGDSRPVIVSIQLATASPAILSAVIPYWDRGGVGAWLGGVFSVPASDRLLPTLLAILFGAEKEAK